MGDSSGIRSRLTIYPIAIILAMAVGVLIGSVAAESRGNAYGGDYPAFYNAGSIAASGDWGELYDLSRQIEEQGKIRPEEDEPSARFFAYPPQVAFVYQPLAALDYFPSFIIHTVLMALILVAALWLARPMIPWLREYFALGLAMALVFWPIFRSVTAGSNTALTLLLVVAAWRLIHDDLPFAAGLVLAVMLFKPQFAVPLVGLFLLRRSWRLVAGAIVGGGVFYVIGVALLGWSWVWEWAHVASEFGRLDAEINGHSAISLVGFAENVFGVGMSSATAVAWGLAGLCVAFLSWLWWRDPDADLDRLMAVTMPGILLISPHAMSHDGALVVITAAVAASRWPVRRWLPWALVVWILGATQLGIKQLGFSPGLAGLLITLIWAYLIVRDAAPATDRDGSSRVSDHRVT